MIKVEDVAITKRAKYVFNGFYLVADLSIARIESMGGRRISGSLGLVRNMVINLDA